MGQFSPASFSQRLDGVFIVPGDNVAWSAAQWRAAMRAIADAGMHTVILQWTVASGRALYPSRLWQPVPGMGVEDLVGTILAEAHRAELGVILGLDATASLEEIHYSPVESPAQRLARLVVELGERYGDSRALRGLYLPREWSALPAPEECQLLVESGTLCRRLRPDLKLCTSIRAPRPQVQGHGWELFGSDPQWQQAAQETHMAWAKTWAELAEAAGLTALLLRDDLGSLGYSDLGWTTPYLVMGALLPLMGGDCELWGQISLYEVTPRRGVLAGPRLRPAGIRRLRQQLRGATEHCDALFGFSFDYLDPAAGGERARLYQAYCNYRGRTPRAVAVSVQPTPPRAAAPGPLLEKANQVENIIEQRHLLEGQIMTVVDYRYDLDHPENQWQEDADWLTGLYTGAESLRYAASGDPEARARARRSFEALCMLSTVSGLRGVEARSSRRSPPARLGEGRKRWVKVEGQDLWWAADISRDQLSGHFFGLAAYHDLVADQSERKLIRRLVSDIAGSILEHRMQAVDWDGEYTIHGNFWVAPFQALALLKIAHHITGEARFDRAYHEYINPHFFLGHAIIQASAILDPFFQHYQYDSPAYHLLQYESNPEILRLLLRALDLLYHDVKDLGNVYLYFVYQVYRPESDAARRGEMELLEFQPERLHVPNWRRYLREYMRDYEDNLPADLRDTLRYCLKPDQAPPRHVASFIPMRLRPPMEFAWQYYAGIQTRGRAGGRLHGDHVGYAGVDYLLAYWMGRYHGFLR